MESKRGIRIRENGGSFTMDQFYTLKKIFNDRCVKCGKTGQLHADHIIPVALGGHSNIDNIQPLCPKCNLSKHTNESIDYRKTFYSRFPLESGREFIFKIRFLHGIFNDIGTVEFVKDFISNWNFDKEQLIYLHKEFSEMEAY